MREPAMFHVLSAYAIPHSAHTPIVGSDRPLTDDFRSQKYRDESTGIVLITRLFV